MPYESTRIATPLIAGVFRPRIILPITWTTWPDETLRAVLAHERAHIRRRDPLIGFLGRVNRCAFWFNPLAWWLERTLVTTAEHACDDAGVRAIGDRRRYAEVLLDMADAVRRSGGRFSWQGIGVDGNGLLGQRIDRILGGDLYGDVSRIRKAMVGVSCAAAIVLAVACRQTSAPAPLRPDPETPQQARMQADQELFNAARAMSPQQVADLDAAWTQNPEDLAALKKLLIFYGHDFSGKKVAAQDAIVAARRPYILWLIEHHPEHELAGALAARIFPTPLDPLPDPAGYAQARALWLAKTSSADVSAAVLGNAARFFEVADKPLAEAMLLRAQAAAPAPQWSHRLGELYAQTIVGSNTFTLFNVVRSVSVADAHSAFAQAARRTLTVSTDDVLLLAAGRYLTINASQSTLDFDHRALGRTCVERALELNPTSIEARSTLASLRAGDRNRRLRASVRPREIELAGGDIARKDRAGEPLTLDEMKTLTEYEYQVVSSLPEPDRFAFLPELADVNYMSAEALAYTDHDQPRAVAAYERSKKYAQEALALAPKFRNNAGYGAAIYRANIALGTHALREGDVRTAVRYMLEAAKAPASDEIAYDGYSLEGRLVNYLLESGERQSVIEFLDRAAQLRARDKNRLLRDAAAIREGRMPIGYQHMKARK